MELVVYAGVALLASYAVTTLMATDQKFTNEGGRVDENRIIGSRYGESIPIVLGRFRLPLNIVWTAPLREERVETTQEGGGKGGGGGVSMTTVSYNYYATFAGIFAKTPTEQPEQSRVLRIWMDKKLVWETPEGQRGLSGDLVGGGSFEFLDGNEDQQPSAIMQGVLGVGNTPGYRDRMMLVFSELPVNDYGARIPTIEVEMSSGGVEMGASVAGVIRAICNEAGVDPDTAVDVSEVNRDVYGAKISNGPAGRVLEDMLLTLGLQSTLTETGISFRPIEQPVAAEIPQGDIIGGSFKVTRVREDDLPRLVVINHIDPARDYLSNSQQEKRQTVRSKQILSLAPTLAMEATEAAQSANALLYRAWTARTRYGPFSLPRKYLYLEPGDVIGVTVDGVRHLIRIIKLNLGANLRLEIDGEAYDASVLTGVAVGAPGTFPGQGLPSFGTTVFRMIDIPNWEETRINTPGFYVAATGTGPAWRHAVVQESIDGETWNSVGNLSVYSILGNAVNALPAPPAATGHYTWDRVNTVDVDVVKGSLSSATESQLYNGANLALLGDEIIQFATATLIAPKRYRLSNLLRGRRNTEGKMATHTAAESFALLDSSLLFVPVSSGSLNASRSYRIVPIGSDQQTTTTFATSGLNAYPFSPVDVKATRTGGAGSDIAVAFTPRSRIGTELPNDGELLSDQSPEEYVIEVRTPDVANTLKRAVVVSSPSWTYTAADQVTDFGASPSSIRLVIWQRSAFVNGAGIPSTTVHAV